MSQEHSYFSWWLAHSRLKRVGSDKYTKNKLSTKLFFFYKIMTRSFGKNNTPLLFHRNQEFRVAFLFDMTALACE